MKKILIISVLLINSMFADCQDLHDAVGIQLSPTLTTLKPKYELVRFKSRPGYALGLKYEHTLGKQFSLVTGISYEQKGAKMIISYIDSLGAFIGNGDVRYNHNYLILPVLGSFSTQGRIKFYLRGGPYLGYFLSETNIYSAVGNYPERTVSVPGNFKNFEFGISMNVGVSSRLYKKMIIESGLIENAGLIGFTKGKINRDYMKTNSIGLQLELKYELN
jgi:hypothetical protein